LIRIADAPMRRRLADNHNAPSMFYVYILTNRKRGTLYAGVTNDLGA
jgi:hypothetical protein